MPCLLVASPPSKNLQKKDPRGICETIASCLEVALLVVVKNENNLVLVQHDWRWSHVIFRTDEADHTADRGDHRVPALTSMKACSKIVSTATAVRRCLQGLFRALNPHRPHLDSERFTRFLTSFFMGSSFFNRNNSLWQGEDMYDQCYSQHSSASPKWT